MTREAIKDELDQLKDEIDRIANTTDFNTKSFLDGDLSTSQNLLLQLLKLEVALGTALISGVDVSGAMANETYTFSTMLLTIS